VIEEQLLPSYDVSDGVAVVVDADAARTWDALLEVDLIELGRRRPLIGMLGALRALPELAGQLVHGEPPFRAPERITLRDMSALPREQGGWVLLSERSGEEIALGLVGKFWRPVIEYADVSAEDFAEFSEPGYAKTIYALSLKPLADGAGTLLSAVMRTATTDERARRWFRRYWALGVRSGAHVLASGLIETARERAER
jgi:hypothetical protein